jgi:hypothetical protein
MALRCYDFHAGGGMVPVTDPAAIAALTRAFTLLLRFGGAPVAVPISEAEAAGFPRWSGKAEAWGVNWLAVGLDLEGRGTYALQSASSDVPALAHEHAREKALQSLSANCATRASPWGRAGPCKDRFRRQPQRIGRLWPQVCSSATDRCKRRSILAAHRRNPMPDPIRWSRN